MGSDGERRMVFTNSAPDDKEWSAFIEILNVWTAPGRYLRTIIQTARSGEFHPSDMYVDLIKQLIARSNLEAQLVALRGLPGRSPYVDADGLMTTVEEKRTELLTQLQQARDAIIGKEPHD